MCGWRRDTGRVCFLRSHDTFSGLCLCTRFLNTFYFKTNVCGIIRLKNADDTGNNKYSEMEYLLFLVLVL